MSDETGQSSSDLAIVGMAGRFPGARNLRELWANLRGGVESVRFFTDEELLAAGEAPSTLRDPAYVKACPVLADIDQYDAAFFGHSPRDAAIMDPQHRFFFETAWEALENAGYVGETYPGPVGVFASCGLNAYMMHHLVPNQEVMATVGEWLVRHTANDASFLATRVSYELDLRGPSMSIQTACSSTLVAIHVAAQSLLAGECDLALAGGSVMSLPQDRGYLYKEGEILSPDGHCRAFDARAQGTLFGSGTGCVVLKRLTDALADGDEVLAVLRGTAINNDGSSKVGYLAPSVEGQARVIAEALAVAGVGPDSISYVETHGTGTVLGDPIEIAALTQAYRTGTSRTGYCAIGSLKPNIGHLGEAAGIAGFIKTVLAMKHRELPPSLHYEAPNPHIDFASTPFFVNARLTAWPSAGGPRRAGVTALGAGGTNAHAILEEAPEAAPSGPSRSAELLVLSARTATALDTATKNLAGHLRENPDQRLADVAFTLQVGRKAFAHRRVVACRDREDGIAALEEEACPRVASGLHKGAPASVVFMFPGGGAQYAGMGADLYASEPVVRGVIDDCARFIRPQLGLDLRTVLFPGPAEAAAAQERIERPSLALPALFATSLAIARLVMSWGIEPHAMIGHSAGEYVAACLAGVISHEEGMSLVALRGRLFEALPEGAMLAMSLPPDAARSHMSADLSFAAFNAPGLCVASGSRASIASLEERLRAREIGCSRLHIRVAAHSPMLEPCLAEFERFCRRIPFKAPVRPYVSNLTGTWITEAEALDPRYWVEHLRRTVRFAEGMATILEQPGRALLEIGPGRTLSSLGRQQPIKPVASQSTLRHPKEEASDVAFLLGTVGRLWLAGVDVDWRRLHEGEQRRRVPLPTYPFERQRLWIERGSHGAASKEPATSLEARADVGDWFHLPSWKRSLPAGPPRPESATPTYLVLADRTGLATRLARRLEPGVIVTVAPGARFGRTGDLAYSLRPGERADYDALIADLHARNLLPQRILHMWSITADAPWWASSKPRPWAGLTGFEQGQELYFYSLLFLAQALAPHGDRLELTIVSNHLHQIAGEAATQPEKATLLGPCRVMPREMPNIASRSVDVILPVSGSWQDERLLGQLASEIAAAPDEGVIAYRGGDRWVQTFDAVRLEPASRCRVREGGVYLITGGLGGLGLELAEHFARAARVKLVLLGRGELPPRSTWAGWRATHDDENRTTRRIQRIEAIEALGSEVMTVSADVTERARMQQVKAEVNRRFGPVCGVIHAAGTLHDVLIELRPPDAASEVIDTKAKGALVLDALFRDADLDFFVLFSSVSSILGLPGQVDYTAANAFLDAFAQQRSAGGKTRVLSIDWSAWQDVGMAAALSPRRSRPTTRATRPGAHPLLERVHEAGDDVVFSTDLSRARQWVLAEHVIRDGEALLPGTAYLEIARAALAEASNDPRAVEIRDVVFVAPFAVQRGETRELSVRLSRSSGEFTVFSTSASAPHVTGKVAFVDAPAASTHDLAAIAARCTARDDARGGFLPQSFMDFGPRWENVRRIRLGRGEALLTLELPAALASDLAQYGLHPALLDMATGGAQALIADFEPESHFYVPLSYGRVLVRGRLPARVHSHLRLRARGADGLAVFDGTVMDETGRELVEITGFVMRRVTDRRAVGSQPAAKTAPSARVDGHADPAPPAWSGSLREAALQQGISPTKGLDAFDRILAHAASAQIVASSIDLAAWARQVTGDARPATIEGPPQATPGEAFARPASSTPHVAPRNAIERELAGYWRELLGVEDIGVHDDFFEVGGQSLIAIRLFHKIRKTYDVDLPLSTLFEAPTIARCAQILQAELRIEAEELPASPAGAVRPTAPRRSRWSSLVPMQPSGARAPFYCVAGMGGNLANLRRLAILVGSDQPFYGLQPPGLDGKQKRLYRVEELASHYIEEILSFQPEGPFLLGGYSGGGVAAFEMTCQLTKLGHRVAFLGFIDSFSPSLPRKSYLARAKIHLGRAADGGPGYVVDLVGRRLAYERSEATRLATRALGKVFPEKYRYDNIGDSWRTAERAYAPGTHDGHATLFRAAEESALSLWTAFDVDPQHGWTRFVRGGVDVAICPGNHASMCEEPHVQRLADALRARLEGASARAA